MIARLCLVSCGAWSSINVVSMRCLEDTSELRGMVDDLTAQLEAFLVHFLPSCVLRIKITEVLFVGFVCFKVLILMCL